jgi:hypothetical protein
LCWHPEKENILAFATNEGRVGTFDTNTKKSPTIYRQFHRHVIYRIGWGPATNVKEYALFTCGDGELVYYNPEKFNDGNINMLNIIYIKCRKTNIRNENIFIYVFKYLITF